MISKELLDILVCPKCKGMIQLTKKAMAWFVKTAG